MIMEMGGSAKLCHQCLYLSVDTSVYPKVKIRSPRRSEYVNEHIRLVSTVAVVARQLIRGNAIANVVFVPWCDKKPREEWPGRSVLTDVARLAWVDQQRPRREADGIGHQNDELLRHVPAHVAHRQPEAEPEEQGIDLLQVVSEPQLNRSNACLNFRHFENSERWLF